MLAVMQLKAIFLKRCKKVYSIGQIVRLRSDRKWIGIIYEVGNNGYADWAKVEWFIDIKDIISSYYMAQLEPL